MRRRGGMLAVFVLAAGLAALPVPAPVAAAGLGAISGKVTSTATGAALANVCVSAIPTDTANAGSFGSATTAADGTYTMSGLVGGHYRVKFDPRCTSPVDYSIEFYNNRYTESTADVVTVVEPLTLANVNASLEQAGSISGTVRNAQGAPVSGVCVRANDERWRSTATTDALGHYRIPTDPGTFHVVFADCNTAWAVQWFDGRDSAVYAQAVTVSSPVDTPNIDATLSRWSTISGTVTDRSTGQPLSGICVNAQTWNLDANVGPVYTDSQGRYVLDHVPPGQWRVYWGGGPCSYSGSGIPPYVTQWWHDTTDINQATPVTTGDATAATGINAALDRAGTISGTVTDESGAPVAGVAIMVRNSQGSGGGGFPTDAQGHFQVTNLAPDNYTIEFDKSPYMTVFYKDQATLATATPIPVSLNHDTGGVNQTMRLGATLSGKVVDSLGQGIPNATIGLEAPNACCSPSISTTADGSGNWTLTGLRTGTYDLTASDYSGGFSQTWYSAAANQISATPVTVGSGANPSLSVRMFHTGRILGRVTDGSGNPLVGACVRAENVLDDPNVTFEAGPATTGSDGAYTMPNVAPGTYYVRFSGCQAGSYGTKYYGNSASRGGAAAVVVNDNADTTGISGSLAPGGAIAGTVTDPSGNPVQYAPVIGRSAAGPDTRAATDVNGRYTLPDLAPGQWTVEFAACGWTTWGGEFYNDSTFASGATPVAVSAGSTTSVNAALNAPYATSPARCRVPGPPTGLSIEHPSAGVAILHWTPPADDGGSDIISYYVRIGPSGRIAHAAGRELRLTGPAASATGFTIHAEVPYQNGVDATYGTGVPPLQPGECCPGGTDGSGGTGGTGGGTGGTGGTGGSGGTGGTGGSGGAPATAHGYWMVDAAGVVYPFGAAPWYGDAHVGALPAVDLEPTPAKNGYWVVDAKGHVFAFGAARYLGGSPPLANGETVTSMSATADGNGYWLFTTAGRVLNYGSAGFYGDMTGRALNGPVLDSVPTPDGHGYYMVASDGGVFAFGDAQFRGSMGAKRLNAPVQSLVPDPDGVGYWLVASDGGIFSFDAAFHGSMGGKPLNRPVTGMVGYPAGYLMVAEDGGIFSFGDAPFSGSLGSTPPAQPVVSVAAFG